MGCWRRGRWRVASTQIFRGRDTRFENACAKKIYKRAFAEAGEAATITVAAARRRILGTAARVQVFFSRASRTGAQHRGDICSELMVVGARHLLTRCPRVTAELAVVFTALRRAAEAVTRIQFCHMRVRTCHRLARC